MRHKNVLIKCKNGTTNVAMHQIEFVEYQDHALLFHLNDGRQITSRAIPESFSKVIENTLDDSRFIKPHASYAVNMDYILSIQAYDFMMASGAQVPISKRIYSQVKQQFVDYKTNRTDTVVL